MKNKGEKEQSLMIQSVSAFMDYFGSIRRRKFTALALKNTSHGQ
jgi:hypothetical protein